MVVLGGEFCGVVKISLLRKFCMEERHPLPLWMRPTTGRKPAPLLIVLIFACPSPSGFVFFGGYVALAAYALPPRLAPFALVADGVAAFKQN